MRTASCGLAASTLVAPKTSTIRSIRAGSLKNQADTQHQGMHLTRGLVPACKFPYGGRLRARCAPSLAVPQASVGIKERFLSRTSGSDRNEKGYQRTRGDGQVLFTQASRFGNGDVVVREWPPWRVLMFNDVEQGLTYMDMKSVSGEWGRCLPEVLGFDYLRAMASAAVGMCSLQGCDLSDKGASALFVGLGSGSLPGFMRRHFPDLKMEVVEIDPLVAFAATKFLGFPTELTNVSTASMQDSKSVAAVSTAVTELREIREMTESVGGSVRVALGDAEEFLLAQQGTDTGCIFLDAYDGAGKIPEHLAGSEFLEACHRALRPGGVVVANLFNGPETTKERQAVMDFALKMEQAIGPVYSIKVVEQQTNVILVACAPNKYGEAVRQTRSKLNEAARRISRTLGFEFDAASYLQVVFWVDTKKGTTFKEVHPGRPWGWPHVTSAVDYAYINQVAQD
eukprot:CAMPEP_0114242074 /NCGR_PEP_ID=MMETSP0058-20121206/9972_1 /TAXON_ID=36894 /ORGANISM="Pyramimonas parkeae, CCMP726" /LENGTH=453 /DNA_ID=CAMNT_0001354643 /DNA_START=132 /DNA_END=1493 /DNA_ORIENTATION=+